MSDPASPPAEAQPPVITIAEPIEEAARLLRSLQALLMRHPFAARAAMRALVVEGRQFAATPEGRGWQARLEQSEIMKTARTFWEALAYPLLADDLPRPLPTAALDDLFAAFSVGGAEAALARAFAGR
jgi:hypothetical protein